MLMSVTVFIKFDKYKQVVISIFVVSLLLLGTTIKPANHELEIIAFDVQNADSFLIKTPENKYFMIDTGKAPYDSGNSQAKIIMLKYLKDHGIKNLEGVIVSHFDNDHSGGVADVITNTKVKMLYLNSTNVETKTAWKIFDTSKKIGQKYEVISDKKQIHFEKDLDIKLIRADVSGENESNENSIITLISYKNFNMLFMGDGGLEAFNQIKKDLPRNIDVLKVGHHGGPRVVSDEMIEYLGNKVSLISTGINYFGHPNKGTLDILRNTEILRTDLLHAIKISSDGKIYKVYSYDTHEKDFNLREKFEAK